MPHSIYNEVLDILTSAFLLPVVIALYRVYRKTSPILSHLSTILLTLITVAGIILHMLVIFGIFSFPEVAYIFFSGLLILSLWLFMVAYLAYRSRKPKHGLLMGILGATIIGYPVWAIWIGRQLISGKLTEE